MKIGLALSGGGSKGAFIVGALESILGRIFPDGDTPDVRVVAGTSTGALIASGIAADDFQTVKDVYENVETKNIVNPHVTIPGV